MHRSSATKAPGGYRAGRKIMSPRRRLARSALSLLSLFMRQKKVVAGA